MSGRSRNNFVELQNPLFVHPSDGHGSLDLKIKLNGSSNFRSRRQAIEIALSTKRKLPFVHGTLPRPTDDPIKGDQWDACNNLIMNSMSDSIAESILYVESAARIWRQLERRFAISNGSRKYKLNKDVYHLKQNGAPINEYYTRMRGIWEELSAMNDLPRFTTMSKNAEARCTVCGVKGHFKGKCWKVIGYPSWHTRGKKTSQRKGGTNKQGQLNTSFEGRTSRSGLKFANQAEYGNVHLCNGLVLKNTLVVPTFKYNLLSVSKLCKDNNCLAIFHEEICLFQDCATWKVKRVGALREGLYYLVNSPFTKVSQLQFSTCNQLNIHIVVVCWINASVQVLPRRKSRCPKLQQTRTCSSEVLAAPLEKVNNENHRVDETEFTNKRRRKMRAEEETNIKAFFESARQREKAIVNINS
ncbi:hypothetical protein Cgig2_004696 [Carnegiea gigantea]|uniref:Retrotransposon Copia-like N-terminal domain-containing protein n=1 Tax=Carnegiea gigantea TaxID=171969 RepID=A0A9Q1GRJ9_9CARY|nr:hypothetical protein Cgig2_004696 [Carnegiea gigantea]